MGFKPRKLPVRNIARGIVYDTVNGVNKFLLIYAKKGYWQNPQGGVDPGERAKQAVMREAKEETGLEDLVLVENVKHSDKYFNERQGKPIQTNITAYAIKADSRQTVVLSEEEGHKAFIWASYEEAYELMDRYPEQRTIFEKICKLAGLKKER